MILTGFGLSVTVPRGWDARLYRRPEAAVASPYAEASPGTPVPQSGWTTPVVHLANFALPEQRGDYGSGAVNLMKGSNVFIALVEFGPESLGAAMFRGTGMPRFRANEISAQAMQRPIAGMGGAQRFFTASGRPFCCYAVVGSLAAKSVLVRSINEALAGISADPLG